MAEVIAFRKAGLGVLLIFQAFLIIMYAVFVRYDPAAKPPHKVIVANGTVEDANATKPDSVADTYPLFQDVHVMIFVGFGFLVTFIKRYAHCAVSFTFLLAAVAIQWAILVHGILHWDGKDHKIYIDVYQMIFGDEAAACVLISFGIVLGKVTPVGLVFMTFIEIPVYVLNDYLSSEILQSMDWGGSVNLHAFGAYFGLGMSAMIALNTNTVEVKKLESSSYMGDVTAMIGTLFLWMFWPSFLAGSLTGDQRYRVIINTYLALLSSCVAAFAFSSAFNKEFKFEMPQIQNATLAGGVAIGTACNADIYPFGALIIGAAGGAVSSMGFAYVQGFLRRLCRIHDTCGAHNLHGLPGLLGGVTGIFTAAFATQKIYESELYVIFPAMKDGRSAGMQAAFQAVGIFVTLAISSVSGILTGVIIRFAFPLFSEENYYKDEAWIAEENESED